MKFDQRMNVNNTPLVSIVVLTYRNFEFLYETLETVLAQDYPNIELILSDDGSEYFPEEELLLWIQAHVPQRIHTRIRRNCVNLGITAHSNAVAKEASGIFIKFITPGDGFTRSDALTQLICFAQQHRNKVIISPALVCKESFANVCYQFPSDRRIKILNQRTPNQLFSVVSSSNIICAAGSLYMKTFFDDGGFCEDYRNLDDWPVWLSIYRRGESIPCMEMPTVYYRIGGLSSVYGNAFKSPALKDDLIHCIEKEIQPYEMRLTWLSRAVVEYQYGVLINRQTLKFQIIYFPIKCYCQMKQVIKNFIIGLTR